MSTLLKLAMLPLYILEEAQRAAATGNEKKKKGWTVQESNVTFGKPYPPGKNFYDQDNPYKK